MSWSKTKEPGIYQHDTISGKFKIVATIQNPNPGGARRIFKRKTLTRATLAEAVAWRQQTIGQMEAAAAPACATIETTSISYFAADWAAEMIDAGRWNPATADTNTMILREHILPQIGHVRVEELGRDHIRRWISYMESATYDRSQSPDRRDLVRYAHLSLRRYWRVLRHLVNAIYLEGHVDRRLVEWCREIRGPMARDIKPRRERQTLTLPELRALVAAAKSETPARYAEIVTLAWTGMRAGELYGLEWSHIDCDRQEIRIEQSFSKGALGPVKTGKSRVVPMIPEIVSALQAHRQALIKQQNIGLADNIVFPSASGTRREASALHKPLAKAADAAGIQVRVGGQVLRRTLITLLKQTGTPLAQIMSIAGHERVETNDGYTAPRPEDLAAPIVKLYGA